MYTSQELAVIEIRTTKGIKLISTGRIIFIQSEKKGTIIHLSEDEDIQATHLLKWYSKQLPMPEFFRCHNSYIINCKLVDFIRSSDIILLGGYKIPLSRRYHKLFKENLKLLLSR